MGAISDWRLSTNPSCTMKFDKSFLRSKVARRMLGFFLLAAFIPILLLAYLSYSESTQFLIKQTNVRLDAASDVYKKSIYEKLLLADQLLYDVIQRSFEHEWADDIEQQLSKRFSSLGILQPDGSMISIFGNMTKSPQLSAIAKKHLYSNQPLLLTQFDGDEVRVLILYARNYLSPDKGIVIAQLNAEYFWGQADVFAMDVNLCVYNEDYLKMFCTQSQIYPSKKKIQDEVRSIKGDFLWNENREKYFANYHEVFLQAKFLTPRWLVIATQPEVDALDSIKKFNTIFWGSVIFTVLLILLISMVQIRRVLIPLEKLVDGIRRLESRDFNTKVPITSSDEFGELSKSFNAMSEKLGDQFQILSALSEIDREILSSLSIDKIVQAVLIHLQKVTHACAVNISIFNDGSTDSMDVYGIDSKGKLLTLQQQSLSNNIKHLLIQSPKGSWLMKEVIPSLGDVEKTNADAAKQFILPLIWKDQTLGYLMLLIPLESEQDLDNKEFVQDYADRIAVALFTKNREQMLIRQARIDALTGLPNRLLFVEQLQKEIAQAELAHQKLAVLYIDLDHFKKVNDSFGHSTGDQLLCDAAKRLQDSIRETDTVARLGGDEFAIIIPQLNSTHQASSIATQAINTLSTPFVIHGEENIVAASIGIAIYPYDGEGVIDLMRNSDIAMYRAKEKSGRQYVFFEESMNAEVVSRVTIERELRRAISERQFVLHYQPQVDPETNIIHGAEALVRWQHPEKGLLSPGHFITIAEDSGLIAEIGQIVLTDACAQYRIWRNEGILLDYVAVNVSVKQFCRENFLQQVKTVLRNNAIPAHCLELEITESVLMDDAQAVPDILEKLKALGVQLSIDDFGTGYSSMSYLERLPFDTLKIDQSFVSKIDKHAKGGVIAGTIAAMAHALGKKIVAEGVETQTQLDFLRAHRCELMQGYFFSRPLPAYEFSQLLGHQKSLPKVQVLR